MSGRGRVDEGHRQFPTVPPGDTLRCVQQGEGNVELSKPGGDPLPVVLEPVGHQHRLSVGGFNQVLQCIQLSVVDGKHTLILAIDGTIRHLGELVAESRSVSGIHLLAAQGNHQLRAHGVIDLPFLL